MTETASPLGENKNQVCPEVSPHTENKLLGNQMFLISPKHYEQNSSDMNESVKAGITVCKSVISVKNQRKQEWAKVNYPKVYLIYQIGVHIKFQRLDSHPDRPIDFSK